ncbi:MAG: DUF4430 domain-containing protein [Clostridia bacterium]|nr:DUF4430 domain-containing protein [Clostridia bacterium]
MQFIKKYRVWLALLSVLGILTVMTFWCACATPPTPPVSTGGVTPASLPEVEEATTTAIPAAETPVSTPPDKSQEQQKAEEVPEKTPETEGKSTENTEQPETEETVFKDAAEESSPQTPMCKLSVRCDSVLGNLSELKAGKIDVIPADGIIYMERTVPFSEGESAFDLLKREMEKANIPLDYENNVIFNSVYIKGISNLYERDCGGFSGWVYTVNGISPNKGCSKYILKAGDKVEFAYTCG